MVKKTFYYVKSADSASKIATIMYRGKEFRVGYLGTIKSDEIRAGLLIGCLSLFIPTSY